MASAATVWLYHNAVAIQNLNALQWLFGSFLAVLAMGFSILPTSFVALVAGYFWAWNSLPFLVISYALATCIGFYISQKIDSHKVLVEINKNSKANAVLGKLESEQFKIVALARLSPVFPFGISNVVFTYLGVPLSKLLAAGVLGMLPRTIFMVWLASNSQNIQQIFQSNWQQYLQSPIFYVGIISVVALFFLVYRAYKSV